MMPDIVNDIWCLRLSKARLKTEYNYKTRGFEGLSHRIK